MSDRFINWLFDTLISVDFSASRLFRGFGVLLLIPLALYLLSYARVSFASMKDRARRARRSRLACLPPSSASANELPAS